MFFGSDVGYIFFCSIFPLWRLFLGLTPKNLVSFILLFEAFPEGKIKEHLLERASGGWIKQFFCSYYV